MLDLSSEIDLSYVLCSQSNSMTLNLRIFWILGMNCKASTTHKLKPSPVGPDILKSKHPWDFVFNTVHLYKSYAIGDEVLFEGFPEPYIFLGEK